MSPAGVTGHCLLPGGDSDRPLPGFLIAQGLTVMLPQREVLGFFGQDRDAAWEEAIKLGKLITDHHAEWTLSIRAEKQRGEWIVALYRDRKPIP